MKAIALVLLASCTARYTGSFDKDVDASRGGSDMPEVPLVDAAAPDAPYTTLPKTPGLYRGSCDGSAAIALDIDHFAGFSDNDQKIRIYKRAANSVAAQTIDISAQLGVATGAKVDFEDVERVGNRIYALSSHGRKNDGVIDPDRYRFAAIDVGGTAPSFTFAVAGTRTRLLSDMLATANWITPDAAVISALQNASQLDQPTNTNLAPKVNGINFEGLAHAPADGQPTRLVLGLRNPRPGGKAVIVSLLNPDEAIAGATARFGEAYVFDLGAIGIRGMTWSRELQQVLIVAGPHDDQAGPFRLYRWAGKPGTTPSFIATLSPSSTMRPEGLVAYPNTLDIGITLDGDDQPVGNTTCDNVAQDQRTFSDLILTVQ